MDFLEIAEGKLVSPFGAAGLEATLRVIRGARCRQSPVRVRRATVVSKATSVACSAGTHAHGRSGRRLCGL